MSEQKYRQRGYMDGDRDERPERRSPQGPRPERRGPRGRGLGKPTGSVFRCAVCGTQQSATAAFDATCSQCGTDLHTCTHCTWFDTGAANECRQPVTEPVISKAKRNRCELFAAKAAQEVVREPTSPASAKDAFDALFDI